MIDLEALNSATKYPSIPTYHALDPRNGLLLDEAVPFTGDVVLTEKVDGTNSRIVLMPDGDWFIGSREELLHARGDRIENPALSIVPVLKPLAQRLNRTSSDQIVVFCLEVYGHKIGGAARQYTTTGQLACRMFDIAFVPLDVLHRDRERIASWRDHGGQTWADEPTLQRAADAESIPLTPRLGTVDAFDLPGDIDGMRTYLGTCAPISRATLDETAGGSPEGIVLRTTNRSVIAKARFQDYERTARRRAVVPGARRGAPGPSPEPADRGPG